MSSSQERVMQWRKSSHSTPEGSNCVEVAGLTGAVAVRDSKNPGGPEHTFSRREFAALTSRIRRGQLDL